MSIFILLAGLPLPVLLVLVSASLLFLFVLLFLVAFAPTASERIVRFVSSVLEWYHQAGEYRSHRMERLPNTYSDRQKDEER